jgi:hypothetical protein
MKEKKGSQNSVQNKNLLSQISSFLGSTAQLRPWTPAEFLRGS